MVYGRVAGVEKRVSRLVMGVDNQRAQTDADVLFDDYFEQGGNCFDSAYIYGQGACETVLGTWMRSREVREQVVVLDKGAHTPHCDPDSLTEELLISLDRLQTDYVDVYMMHRDNWDIPVDEFVDVLGGHWRAGRIRSYGLSNWYIPRIQQFNEHTARRKVPEIAAVSNNLSLAVMVEPPWDGCLHASDTLSRAWFEKTQTPLMPWSSQARGFFVRGGRHFFADSELARCWYAESNFRRLDRARELAAQKDVDAIHIALAYVLCQPFPTFPLIGPRSIGETRSSMRALDVELSPEQLRWLSLGT